MMRFKLQASVAVAAVAALLAVAPAQAGSDYSHAQYQITFSLNCDNPSAPCQNVFPLGGAWGWIALLPDHTSNAQVTECSHTVGGGGPGSAGAGHTYSISFLGAHGEITIAP
jgi:hypothetical protein